MSSAKVGETEHFLKNDLNTNPVETENNKQSMSIPYAMYVMIATMFGAAIIVQPFIAKNFGLLYWFLTVMSCFVIAAFCSVLLKEVVGQYSKRIESQALVRDPYVQISEIVSKRFSRLVQVTLYAEMVFVTLGCQLIAATNLNHVIPLKLEYYNRIRVWLFVCYLAQLPFSLRGTTRDFGFQGIIAFVLSLFSACSIQVLCGVAHFYYKVDSSFILIPSQLPPQRKGFATFFKLIGECWFTTLGVSLLLPNIVVLVRKPKLFDCPMLCSYWILLGLFAISGAVPYLVFGENIRKNLLDTLNEFILYYDMSRFWYTLLTMAEISLSVHFVIVSDLMLKPVFSSLEQVFDMSTGKLFGCIFVLSAIYLINNKSHNQSLASYYNILISMSAIYLLPFRHKRS